MSLQRLYKWRTPFPNLKINEPILVVEESPLANVWFLGIIVELHTRIDERVRVVTVRTRAGLFKQAMTRIATLSIAEKEQSSPQSIVSARVVS